MEVNYRSADGRFSTKLTGDGETAIVEALFDFYNLFEKNNVCGLCQSEDVFFNVRKVDGNTYYEKKCSTCSASLPFHQSKPNVRKNGLFTKWSDQWKKWEYKPKDEDDAEDNQSKTKKGK
jgi:hypothetical protein